MRKQPETLFKEKFRKLLDGIPRSFFIKIQQRVIRGVPDFLGVVNGHFVAIELKTDKKGSKVDPLQAWTLDKIGKAGGYIWTARPSNSMEVIKDLKELSNGKSAN